MNSPGQSPPDASQFSAMPCLTASLPGIGGRIKEIPEHFVVEEIPAYEPCGEGEHLFLRVEKRDLSGEQLLDHLARTLRIGRGDIGMAGLKDRRAVTRQWVSVPGACEGEVNRLESDAVRVLDRRRHGNKLRTGHLKGNRFEVVVASPGPAAATRAAAVAAAIGRLGFPNYYGEQRFGRDGETFQLGLALLRGEKSERDIPPRRRKFLSRLALSSVQSMLFNEVLAVRVAEGRVHQVLPGDVMQVVQSGGPFVVTDVAREQERYDRRETVLSGPMFGLKMKHPEGEPLQRETAALERWGLTAADFHRVRKLLPGTRRPMIIWPEALECAPCDDGIRLTFELPSGSYATSLLREFVKEPESSSASVATDS